MTGTVVLEYASEGRTVQDGRAYTNRYVSVLTISDRQVTRWRDYLDPVAVFDALGWPDTTLPSARPHSTPTPRPQAQEASNSEVTRLRHQDDRRADTSAAPPRMAASTATASATTASVSVSSSSSSSPDSAAVSSVAVVVVESSLST